MLLSISIQNYTLVESLEIEFKSGTTAITGETGAGKSLVLDALGMALGDRADVDTIRHSKDRAEITAIYDVTNVDDANQWLLDNDFDSQENCILRRIYTREGRSRGYINGHPSTMSQLKELGEILTDIHSQHEHQSLLRADTHRKLLDEYAGAVTARLQVNEDFKAWHAAKSTLNDLVNRGDELEQRKILLTLQVDELQKLDVTTNHLIQLEREQKLLASAEQILQDSHNLLDICERSEEVNLRDNLNRSLSILNAMPHKPTALATAENLLHSGLIQLEEAITEITHHIDRFEADPQRLQALDEELSAIFALARKHRVNTDQLEDKKADLMSELDALVSGSEDLAALQQRVDELASIYEASAEILSTKRVVAAEKMATEINHQLQSLAMQGAQLAVQLKKIDKGKYHPNGMETIEFLLSTNVGQPHKPLAKIASGGELSRVSLAIQVVAASHSQIPTLVFDEVDVGIGGSTADIVGRLLKDLGQHGQVISVTHQPQVAAHARQHYVASKVVEQNNAQSLMVELNTEQRIEELARMLGGASVTEQSRSHAAELLDLASS
ncbi:DNA repair protein RecN [Porticoccaceae bacterium]|nr:DNA repair protein RecN [Porticoccaceae bacterium]